MRELAGLMKWCKSMNADVGQLDILVEDLLCQQATRINTRGLKAQLQFLLQHMSEKELKVNIRHELYQLRKYQMRLQSKLHPENNIKIKGSRGK